MTVTDALAMSYLNSTSVTAGSAAKQALTRKENYAALALSHNLIPFAIEATSPIGSKASSFLRSFSVTTGNPRESAFLFS